MVMVNKPIPFAELAEDVSLHQGRRHGFFSGGTNRRQVANLPPNSLKIGKDARFGPFCSRICRGRPLPNFSLVPSVPPISTPMAFTAPAVSCAAAHAAGLRSSARQPVLLHLMI